MGKRMLNKAGGIIFVDLQKMHDYISNTEPDLKALQCWQISPFGAQDDKDPHPVRAQK